MGAPERIGVGIDTGNFPLRFAKQVLDRYLSRRGFEVVGARKTQISVSSAKSEATTDLAAKLAGSVDITFKSDYFKLDNFATMYGPVTEADKAEAGAGT